MSNHQKKIIRTYSEMIAFDNFEDRFKYLKLNGIVSDETYGFDRYLNQKFYKSKEWKQVRDFVISRDIGCDLAVPNMEISGPIYIHHMNPITIEDIEESSEYLLNPNFLVCVSFDTHNALHYGDVDYINKNKIIDRKKDDTCLWKKY